MCEFDSVLQNLYSGQTPLAQHRNARVEDETTVCVELRFATGSQTRGCRGEKRPGETEMCPSVRATSDYYITE